MNNELLTAGNLYGSLINDIGNILVEARGKICREINSVMVDAYWNIGKYIVEYEQKGEERAEYGSNLLNRLSKDLTRLYGKGFGKSNLLYIRKLYLYFPKGGTVSHLLNWSHYYEILKLDNELERSFYVKECEKQHWSVRELKRQMNSMLFHRIALSKDKEGVLRLAEHGNEVQKPEDIIRDPFVLEFAGLPDINHYDENDLEKSLVSNLGQFLLELLCKGLHKSSIMNFCKCVRIALSSRDSVKSMLDAKPRNSATIGFLMNSNLSFSYAAVRDFISDTTFSFFGDWSRR